MGKMTTITYTCDICNVAMPEAGPERVEWTIWRWAKLTPREIGPNDGDTVLCGDHERLFEAAWQELREQAHAGV